MGSKKLSEIQKANITATIADRIINLNAKITEEDIVMWLKRLEVNKKDIKEIINRLKGENNER